jgi:PmbA protein
MYEKEFKYIFDYAADLVDDIEILLSSENSFSTRIHAQQVESFKYSDTIGIGIRILKAGKVGIAYTEKFDEESFRMIVDEAIENSQIIENDEKVSFENYPEVKTDLDLYSLELDEVKVDAKIQFTKDLEKYSKESDERIINVPYSVMGDGKFYVKIANSKGLDKAEKQNYAYAYVGCLAADENEKRMAFEMKSGRDFSKFSAREMAEKSAEKSIALLGGEEIKTGKYPVVFNNETTATLLSTFSGVFSAKAVQEGKSLLAGKMGQKIATDKISIIDDALHPEGHGSRSFDMEGYPSQKTILVDKGELRSFLHNTITARKANTSSTGNAARNYKSSLVISTTNFYLEPGDIKREELFHKHDRIIEIVSLQGMHSGANTISGDFSLSGEGFLWENGSRKHSLKQFTLSGNFLQLLNDIEAIADDFEFNMSSYGASSILVGKLAISGS